MSVEQKKLILIDTRPGELKGIYSMEQGAAWEYIIPYSLEQRHQAEFARPEVVYKSVWLDDEPAGYIILALDSDGRSVEFRRILIAGPGRRSVRRYS